MNPLARKVAESRITRIVCHQDDQLGGASFISAVEFLLQDAPPILLGIDEATDELVWLDRLPKKLSPIDFSNLFPSVKLPCGVAPLWVWEMKNQQGYFDAVQLQFPSMAKSDAVILQFKAAASDIQICKVSILHP